MILLDELKLFDKYQVLDKIKSENKERFMYLYSSTSDEVGHGCALWNHLSRIGNSVEDFEVSVQLGVKFQNACHVTAAIAVVWRRPNSNQVLAWEHVLVALLYQLVSTADQLQAVHSTELIRHFRSEKPTSTARTDLPCFNEIGRAHV